MYVTALFNCGGCTESNNGTVLSRTASRYKFGRRKLVWSYLQICMSPPLLKCPLFFSDLYQNQCVCRQFYWNFQILNLMKVRSTVLQLLHMDRRTVTDTYGGANNRIVAPTPNKIRHRWTCTLNKAYSKRIVLHPFFVRLSLGAHMPQCIKVKATLNTNFVPFHNKNWH
jgi:hypothetical protein